MSYEEELCNIVRLVKHLTDWACGQDRGTYVMLTEFHKKRHLAD